MAFMEPMDFIPPADHTRLTLLDKAFFQLEDPGKHNMHIGGVWIFDEKFEYEWLCSMYTEWIKKWSIFTKKRVGQRWVPVENFDIKDHVKCAQIPSPAGKAELQAFIAQQMADPLDYNKPLWRSVIVDNYEGNRTVFMTFIHHAITDGQGGLRLLLSMCQMSKEAHQDVGYTHQRKLEKEKKSQKHQFIQSSNILLRIFSFVLMVLAMIWKLLTESILMGVKYATLTVMPSKIFKKRGGHAKEVGLSEALSLDEVKAVGAARNATVNDVLIAVLTRCLHTYLAEQGQLNGVSDVYCFMPISLRAIDDFRLSNKVSMALAQLPVSIEDPVLTLDEVHLRLDALKHSWEVYIAGISFSLFALMPDFIAIPWIHFYKQSFQTLLTNVPGPRREISFHGYTVKEYYALPPQPRPGGLGLAVMAYNGKVTLTVVADKDNLLPSTDHFMGIFKSEFEILKKAILPQVNVDNELSLVDEKRAVSPCASTADSGFNTDSEESKIKQE